MLQYLFRRNVVLEALRGSRRPIHQLWLQKKQPHHTMRELITLAQQRGIEIREAGKEYLTELAGDKSHQGVVLAVEEYPYNSPQEMLALAKTKGEMPFFLILDLVQGPQNVGILLRTAEACGVHGVILQKKRAPEITPHIVAFSAGATEHLLIAKETNIVQTMSWLKEQDVWLVGLDIGEDAQLWGGTVDLNMPIALVVGHEGQGMRRLVRQTCDLILQLPMRGQVGSLNAAVAGTVALYAAWQARGFK